MSNGLGRTILYWKLLRVGTSYFITAIKQCAILMALWKYLIITVIKAFSVAKKESVYYVVLGAWRHRLKPPLTHISSLGDLRPVIFSQPNLFYRVTIENKRGKC